MQATLAKRSFALIACWFVCAGCAKKLDCGPGAFVNADPAFCVKLPDGYEASQPQGTKPTSMQVHPKSSILGYTVYWNEDGSLDERAAAVSRMGGGLSSLKLESSELENRPTDVADQELESCKSLRAN